MKRQYFSAPQTCSGVIFSKLLGMLFLSATLMFTAVSKADSVSKVDINSADSETLARELTGVGDSLSKAIVEERSANGPYLSADDLQRVNGIGAAVVKKNRTRIVLGDEGSDEKSTTLADKSTTEVEDKDVEDKVQQ